MGGSPQDKFEPFFCLVGLGFYKLGVHLVVIGERIWHAMKETASPVVSSLSINLIELLLSLSLFSFFGGRSSPDSQGVRAPIAKKTLRSSQSS